MNYHQTCPHCGAVTTAYLVNMNEGLARAFVQFAEARIRLGRPVKKSELDLDHSQYGNFQKLRHFELVEKRDGGTWEMTVFGWNWFLYDYVAILTPAAQFGNATLPANHPAWSTHKEPRKAIRLVSILAKEWAQRAHYAAQKRGAA